MKCEIGVEELAARGSVIVDMLRPLVGKVRPAFERQTESRTQVYLAVHTGPRPVVERRDWRFSTLSPRVNGAYLERWLPVDERGNRYFLNRSYLHLYWKLESENAEEEIVGLHCDPNEPDDSDSRRHARYKRGPHVHLTTRRAGFSHSHIALNLMDLDTVLDNIDNLTDAMKSGIQMLRDQVLDLL
jgi:hypothetical protein